MSRSRFKAPFHRRILPWIYAIVFVVIAPTILFYTAGYRLSPQKRVIEHNGTLIVESEPSNATIFLNGVKQDRTTEATIQRLPPGTYTIRVQKEGFHPWEKELEIKPDQVTFATGITLWSLQEATTVTTTQESSLLSSSPSGKDLAHLVISSTTQLSMYRNDTLLYETSVNLISPKRMFWSPDETSVQIESTSSTYLYQRKSGQLITVLPFIDAAWSDESLSSYQGTKRLSFDRSTKQLTSTPLNPNEDVLQNAVISFSTSTNKQLLWFKEEALKHYALPSLGWYFIRIEDDRVFLKNDRGQLALFTVSSKQFTEIPGSIVGSIEFNDKRYEILMSDHELRLWDGIREPKLLLRTSTPLAQIAIDAISPTIFYHDGKTIYALDIDERDGYLQTPIVTLDSVQSVGLQKNTLFFTGSKNNQTNLWKWVLR